MVFFKKSKKFLVGVVCAVAMLICANFCFSFTSKTTDSSAMNVSGATLIGSGADLWDASKNDFSKKVYEDLLEKLFGKNSQNKLFSNSEQVSYIQSNGVNENTSCLLVDHLFKSFEGYIKVPQSSGKNKYGGAIGMGGHRSTTSNHIHHCVR